MSSADERKYKISVICPVFDSEQYLDECIESVLNQTIGFRDNIQLVFIDDASMDTSPEICLGYLKRYPDNIVYIRNDEKKGISHCRNQGMDIAVGEYLSFLDSDDIWDLKAFKSAARFLDQRTHLDCVFTEIQNIGAHTGTKYVNDFYDSAKVIDIQEVTDKMARNLNNGFFRGSALNSLRFHENPSGDDELKFITEVILNSGRYGHIKGIKYFYRKRTDNTNAEQSLRLQEGYYTDFYDAVVLPLKECSEKKYGCVSSYTQNILLDCVKRRLRQKTVRREFQNLLDNYFLQLHETLKLIDDRIIIAESGMPIENKVFALNLKYGDKYRSKIRCEEGNITFNGLSLCNPERTCFVKILYMEILDDKLILIGRAGIPFDSRYRIVIQDEEGNEYPCDNNLTYSETKNVVNKEAVTLKGFRLEVPARDSVLRAYIYFGERKYYTCFEFGNWSKLSNYFNYSYYFKSGIAVSKSKNGSELRIETAEDERSYERRFIRELIAKKKIRSVLARAKRNRNRKKKGKPIWLFIDRVNYANENSLFLFEYINEKYGDEIDCYYVIGKEAAEYEEIKARGHVLIFGSEEMRDKFVCADAYIVSQTFDFSLFPTGVSKHVFRDSVPRIYAYMQHGVLEKDVSLTQNKTVTNFNVFVTSAYEEYKHMFKYPYGYTEDEVFLTGLARHDLILKYAEVKGNQLIIAPTWRHNISTRMDKTLGGRGYNHEFKYSEFYKFYNSLINDARILDKLRAAGFKGVLRLHPYMRAQEEDFQINELFTLADGIERYDKQFEGCALLVTDYSSIASDYAYACKPVIYSQFDKDTFYEGHSYEEGFFDYEKDGFGPVCYDYESTVKEICDAIDRGCVIEDKYLERRKAFFAHFDGNNRERIYQAIKKQCERYSN